MKAILVLEMPKNCDECPLLSERTYFNGQCDVLGNYLDDIFNKRYERCPLKPLPTKITTATLSDQEQERTELFTSMALLKTYADGWNDCLEEIESD